MISFIPSSITEALLADLPDRARDVLQKRFGLNKKGETFTLEAIGQSYGITRERVRQIENYGVQSVQKSDAYKKQYELFLELQKLIDEIGGGIIAEHILLDELTDSDIERNHLFFLLTVGDVFYKSKENPHYAHRWYTQRTMAETVEQALRSVRKTLKRDDLVSEQDIISRFKTELAEIADQHNEEVLKRWLQMSKQIGQNPLGDWGHAESPNIRVKGIRDYAYLVVKRHGSPMHFKEVAGAIKDMFERKAHVATTHNELIKDDRFVLVGRGLYALSEWGYTAGVVKEVLREILENEGPLSREEIIDRVRRERHVKDNTIIVNLQDATHFKRLANGAYTLV